MSQLTMPEIQISPKIPIPKNKINFKFIALTGLKVVVSTALAYYVLRKTNLEQIWISIKGANVYLLFISLSLHAVGYYVSVLRWKILLGAYNMKISASYLLKSYAVSVYFNNFLPSIVGGDVARAYDTWRLGYSKGKAIIVVLVDRFLGLLVLLGLAVVAIFVATDFAEKIPGLIYWVLGVFILMVLITVAIFLNQNAVGHIGSLMQKSGLVILKKQLKKFADVFKELRGKNKALFQVVLLSLILQINVIVYYWLISQALGMNIPLIKFLFIIPITLFVMMAPISINAIGLRENLYVFFLTPYGATVAGCIAFSWIAYSMSLLLGILGGIVLVFRNRESK